MFDSTKLVQKFSHFLVNNPIKLLLASLVLCAGLGLGLQKMKADFTYRIWFRTTDPLIKTFDEFEETFGNDDTIVVLMHSPKGIFNPQAIKLIQEVTEKLWTIQDVMRVDSLTNYQWTHAIDDDILVEDFIGSNLNQRFLNRRKKIAQAHEVIPDYLINKDANVSMIYAKVKPFPGGAPNDKRLIDDTRKLISSLDKPEGYRFFINGGNAITNTFSEVSAQDSKVMIPLVLGLITLFLIFFFRSFTGVLIPFVIIITTMITTFGVSGFANISFNNIIFMVPFVIIAISIADTVHILVTYFQFRREGYDKVEGTRLSFEKNIMPTFLTSLSTAVGFFSFAYADLIPLANFGRLAGIGTLFAWLLTIMIIAPLLSIIPVKVKKIQEKKKENSFYLGVFNFTAKYRRMVFLGFLILFSIGTYIGFQNEVNSNPYAYFSKRVPLRIANDFGLEMIGGVNGPEIVVDSGEVDGIKTKDFLNRLEKFHGWLESQTYVNRAVSIIDIIKSMNRSFNSERQSFYKIPQNDKSIAELLFLYTMSLPQGMDLNDRISLDNSKTRLSVLWSSQDSKSSLKHIETFKSKAQEFGLNIQVTGKIPIYQGMNDLVVDTFFSSIAFAIIGISILLIIAFGSFKVGLASMLPNILPLGLGAGLMTILSKPIDIGSALVTSVCLGIVVDDTIHFLANYNKYINEGMSPLDAVKKVTLYTGPALFTTSIILMVGFGILSFSSFIPNVNFGILTMFIIGIALIVDLTFLPAMLTLRDSTKEK